MRFPESGLADFEPLTGLLKVMCGQDEIDKVQAICLAFGSRATDSSPPREWSRACSIMLPSVDLRAVDVRQAASYLQAKAASLGGGRNTAKTLKIVVQSAADNSSATLFDLRLHNVPLSEVLRYVAELTGFQLRANENEIILKSDSSPD